jgi:hypothetical protein
MEIIRVITTITKVITLNPYVFNHKLGKRNDLLHDQAWVRIRNTYKVEVKAMAKTSFLAI